MSTGSLTKQKEVCLATYKNGADKKALHRQHSHKVHVQSMQPNYGTIQTAEQQLQHFC